MSQSTEPDRDDRRDREKPRIVVLDGQSAVKGPGLKDSDSDTDSDSDSDS